MFFAEPTITIQGGEDPEIRRPYAYIPNGPCYWSREEFERRVSPEARDRFIFPPAPQVAPASAHAPAPAATEAPAKAILADGVYDTPAGAFVVRDGDVTDEYGNYLFPAPASVDELPALWREYRENFDE